MEFDPLLSDQVFHPPSFSERRLRVNLWLAAKTSVNWSRIILDMTQVHEYSHFIDHVTTSYGLIIREMYDRLLLQFVKDMDKALESKAQLVAPINSGESMAHAIFSATIRLHKYVENFRTTMYGDPDAPVNPDKEHVKVTIGGKTYPFINGTYMLSETKATILHTNWIDTKTEPGFTDRLMEELKNLSVNYYWSYKGFKWMMESGKFLEKLEEEEILRLIDWCFQVPFDIRSLPSDDFEGLCTFEMIPWQRFEQLMLLCREENNGKLPVNVDEFMSNYYENWGSYQTNIRVAIDHLESENCGIPSIYRMIFKSGLRTKLENPELVLNPFDVNGNGFITETLKNVIGHPPIADLSGAAYLRPSDRWDQKQFNLWRRLVFLWDMYSILVEGKGIPCIFRKGCEKTSIEMFSGYTRWL